MHSSTKCNFVTGGCRFWHHLQKIRTTTSKHRETPCDLLQSQHQLSPKSSPRRSHTFFVFVCSWIVPSVVVHGHVSLVGATCLFRYKRQHCEVPCGRLCENEGADEPCGWLAGERARTGAGCILWKGVMGWRMNCGNGDLKLSSARVPQQHRQAYRSMRLKKSWSVTSRETKKQKFSIRSQQTFFSFSRRTEYLVLCLEQCDSSGASGREHIKTDKCIA